MLKCKIKTKSEKYTLSFIFQLTAEYQKSKAAHKRDDIKIIIFYEKIIRNNHRFRRKENLRSHLTRVLQASERNVSSWGHLCEKSKIGSCP